MSLLHSGTGHQSTSVFCTDTQHEDEVVEDLFCQSTPRPAVQIRECNQHLCNPVPTKYKPHKTTPGSQSHQTNHHHHHQWHADAWGPCTVECGGGSQARRVVCLRLASNGSHLAVGDFHCTRHTQPATERRCHAHACPEWQTSAWGECSATCGRGSQTRTVKCVDHKGYDDDMQCDKTLRPTERRVCKVSSYCPAVEFTNAEAGEPVALEWSGTSQKT